MGITPNQWQRVKELYEAALVYSASEREVFLLEQEPDQAVRVEVQRLLREQDKLGSFLSTPAFADPRKYAKSDQEPMASPIRFVYLCAGEMTSSGLLNRNREIAS